MPPFGFIKTIIQILIVLSITLNAEGNHKREYSWISVLGADMPFSYGVNKVSPIIYLSYWQYYTNKKNSYCELSAQTTTVSAAVGIHNEKYNTGIKPIWGHTIYGAYSDYNKGYTNSKDEIKGFYMGMELYLKYNWSKILDISISYLPAYHYYTAESNTNMVKPEPHREHNAGIQIQLKNLSEKNFGIIKNGFLVKAKYLYTYRDDYSFNDRIMYNGEMPGTSNNTSTYRYYADFGLYFIFSEDYNLKFESRGSWQINVDRNNAEKIGSMIADHAVIPGYFFCEFYHDKYVIGKIKFGIPFNVLQARIEPAYNILYMPKENKVIGVMDYPRKYYQSISLEITMRIASLVPVLIDYGYGINAERRNRPYGPAEKGSHEVRVISIFAFGKT